MAHKIIFISHAWGSADIVGTNLVVNDGGVLRQFPIKSTNPQINASPPEGFVEIAQGLGCAGVAVSLTIDGEAIDAAMCLKIYSALVAILFKSVNKGQTTTVFSSAKAALTGGVTRLKSCCGGS